MEEERFNYSTNDATRFVDELKDRVHELYDENHKLKEEVERLNNIINEAIELTNKIIEVGWDYDEKDTLAIKLEEILKDSGTE